MNNKDKIFNELIIKGITKEELEQKLEENKKWLIDKGVNKDVAENYALVRLVAFYRKMRGEMYKGFIYGVDRINDFGAKKLYDTAKALYIKNPEEAISQGLVDADGNPLYSGNRAPKDGSIKRIDVEKDRIKNVYAWINFSDVWQKRVITLRSESFNIKIPQYLEVEFRAVPSKKDSLILYATKDTEFKVLNEKEINYKQFLDKNVPKEIQKINALKKWHELNKDNRNREITITGAVSTIWFNEKTGSNMLSLISLETDDIISCWIPKEMKINFDENAINLIVSGQTTATIDTFKNEEKLNLNAHSVWCPPEFRVVKEEIKIEKVKEVKEEEQTDISMEELEKELEKDLMIDDDIKED